MSTLVSAHTVPVRFTYLLRGPGADPEGAAFVRAAHVGREKPDVYPPDVLLVSPDGRVLDRIDYGATPSEVLAALIRATGVGAPPEPDALAALRHLEARLHAGEAPLEALQAWRAAHEAEHPDGAVLARILEGAAWLGRGGIAEAEAAWLNVLQDFPDHPLRHRARYHLHDPDAWPTRNHPDVGRGRGARAWPADVPDPARRAHQLHRLREDPRYRRLPSGAVAAWVPPGPVTVGGSPAWLPRELPTVNARLERGVWVMATVVTRGAWSAFDARRWPADALEARRAELPATGVSHPEARAYATWLAERDGVPWRLPTELEWERAARGGLEGCPYPWGHDPITPDRACYAEATPVPVASYEPNPWGLYDMVGLVQEWTGDRFLERRYDDPASLGLPDGPARADGGLPLRAVRGGLCGAPMCAVMCRVSFRLGLFEEYDGHSVGLRLVFHEP